MNGKKYSVVDFHYENGKIIAMFDKKEEALDWCLDGIEICEGCERDPYCNALLDLLKYNRKSLRFA